MVRDPQGRLRRPGPATGMASVVRCRCPAPRRMAAGRAHLRRLQPSPHARQGRCPPHARRCVGTATHAPTCRQDAASALRHRHAGLDARPPGALGRMERQPQDRYRRTAHHRTCRRRQHLAQHRQRRGCRLRRAAAPHPPASRRDTDSDRTRHPSAAPPPRRRHRSWPHARPWYPFQRPAAGSRHAGRRIRRRGRTAASGSRYPCTHPASRRTKPAEQPWRQRPFTRRQHPPGLEPGPAAGGKHTPGRLHRRTRPPPPRLPRLRPRCR